MSSTGDKIKRQGWRQGSILRDGDLANLLPETVSPASSRTPVCIIVSHSCDLAHADDNAEPFAEIILGHSIDGALSSSEIGGLTHGKNPRRLCLELHSHPSGKEWFEFRPYEVHRAAKERLAELEPEDQRFLPEDQVRILSTWLADRFRRTALPDTFNNLLKPHQKKLNRLYKRLSPSISAIYIRLLPNGELELNQQYAADLLLTVPASRAEHLADAMEGVDRLKNLLRQAGIDVRAVAKSESDVSLQTIRSMNKLPLDALSLKGDQHPLDAESETDSG
mgnify:CR=1 FL=1